ncbi:hypothetical protein HPY86_03995 [candidate division WOR-3 bacterium]|nr:hypothetical protein [candidate division WOR-3 bacterium]
MNHLEDRLDKAPEALFKAMEFAHNAEHFADEADALVMAALIRMGKGSYRLARAHLEKVRELYQKIGDYDGFARCRFYQELLDDIEYEQRRFQVLDSCLQELRRRTEIM